MLQIIITESGQGETGIQIFCAVIPKEGLADISPAKSSFRITPIIELYSEVFTIREYNLWSVSYKKEELAGLVPSNLSIGMTVTKI